MTTRAQYPKQKLIEVLRTKKVVEETTFFVFEGFLTRNKYV